MTELIPSIFNDVLGPVMRGPSSSHCAAAFRIGKICHDLMAGSFTEIEIVFDKNGSLATTHQSQGSDMGLFAGLLGWDADDEGMLKSETELITRGIKLSINIKETGAVHPNTYELLLKNDERIRSVKAISTGGGMIEIIEIDEIPLSINGDFFELLISTSQGKSIRMELGKVLDINKMIFVELRADFIQLKSSDAFDEKMIRKIVSLPQIIEVVYLHPVLPVISQKINRVPFSSCFEMFAYAGKNNISKLWELALDYEIMRGNMDASGVRKKMKNIVAMMDGSIRNGLAGTEYKDRILGAQSLNFKQKMDKSQLLDGGMLNRMILYISAVMETKSSMGVIVAAPTAGSCGTVPGTLIAAAEFLNASEDDLINAMLVAGLTGVFIASNATFAAEIAGCQAECGAASAMAAAALVSLASGNMKQSINAASLALQNSLGMICDPIANRVEAPCLGKNIMAASNALSCANMALADYDPLISFDEVVKTMLNVGRSMPHELRCTALGGLSITKSSKEIENQLRKNKLF